MSGALFELVSRGTETLYLDHNPQITLFKIVYRRHSNFSTYDLSIIPKVKNSFDVNFTAELPKAGDLLHKTYLVVSLPKLKLKKKIASYENISGILQSYGIIWLPPQIPKIITLPIYNNEIINVINAEIITNVDYYNFYSNSIILSTNPPYLIKSFQVVIDRAIKGNDDYLFAIKNDSYDVSIQGTSIRKKISNLTKTMVSNNIVESLMVISKILTKYSQEYIPVYNSKYNEYTLNFQTNKYSVATDISGQIKKKITLYSNNFRTATFNIGILFHALINYYYDTSILNVNTLISQDHSQLQLSNKDYFTSNPLFGELLNRPPNILKNDFVQFKLYNFIDIQKIYYITLLYNLTRLKIESLHPSYEFKLDHKSIYVNDVEPHLNESKLIGIHNPYITLIDDCIIFYHIIDPSITKYELIPSTIGTNISIFYNDIIQKSYKLFDTYQNIFPFYNDTNFILKDAYKIYQKYINIICVTNNTADTVVRDLNQIQKLAELINFHIQYNIQYNFAIMKNAITILHDALYTNKNHYRFTYFKKYKQTATIFSQTTSFSVIDDDNFESKLLNNLTIKTQLQSNFPIPTTTPLGANIINFFGTVVKETIKSFRQDSLDIINVYETKGYMSDFTLWKRCLFDLGNKVHETYFNQMLLGTNPPFNVVNSFDAQYKQIVIMNYIPFLAVRDIPSLIYYIYSTCTETQIIFTTFYNGFLNSIDFRDSGDDGSPILGLIEENIKKLIYQRLIDSVIGIDTTIVDDAHFKKIVTDNALTTNDFILSNTLRPETLFPQYSEEGPFGTLIDNGTDISYLPIEWLTQTYFKIFKERIIIYVNSIVSFTPLQKTTIITRLVLLLSNVINCFISTSNLPTYDQYKANGYILLGLTPETNGIDAAYLISLPNTEKFKFPKICDSMSSILYQTQKQHIVKYNAMFNNVILSKSYYANDLGNTMSKLFDFLKYTINGDRSFIYHHEKQNFNDEQIVEIANIAGTNLTSNKSLTIIINGTTYGTKENTFEENVIVQFNTHTTVLTKHDLSVNLRKTVNYAETYDIPPSSTNCLINYVISAGYQVYLNIVVFLNDFLLYYDENNLLLDKILSSFFDSVSYNARLAPSKTITSITSETYKPVIAGFDFYRLRNLNNINKYTGMDKYEELVNIIDDNVTMFNYNLQFYNNYKSILTFINNTEFLRDVGDKIVTVNNADYFFEKSEKICNLLNEHINLKYIEPLPLIANSNDITTLGKSDINQETVLRTITVQTLTTNADKLGFAFHINESIETTYGIGFGVASYPFSEMYILLLKKNGNYYLSLNDGINIQYIPLGTTNVNTDTWYFIQHNDPIIANFKLELYKNNTIITSITPTNAIYNNIANFMFLNNKFFIYIKDSVSITFLDLKKAYSTAMPFIQSIITLLTKWFYAGGINVPAEYYTILDNITEILHNTYYEEPLSFETVRINFTKGENTIFPTGTGNTGIHTFNNDRVSNPIINSNGKQS